MPIHASTLRAAEEKSTWRMFLLLLGAGAVLAPLLVLAGAIIGTKYIVIVLVALLLGVAIVSRPMLGLYVITICVALVDQAPLPTPILTDTLPIFYWPSSLTGLPERPIGFLLLLVVLVFAFHRLLKRERPLWGGPLFWPFVLFLLAVAIGVVHGLTSGGIVNIIVLEVRPLWYLFVAYLLAYNMLFQKRQVRSLIWILIIGAAIKGVQGTYIYLVVFHGNLVGHNEIMSHEESFFFVAMLLLLLLFCMHSRYRPQLIALLLSMPFVLLATVGNQRRADYIALLVGILVAWTLIYLVKPAARQRMLVGMLIAAVLGAGYVLAFSHSSASIAQPARAVSSIFNPSAADPRDASSNLYRQTENDDLKFTVKQSPLIGWGFGKPFLQPVPLPDITGLDPYFNYIPHNTIFWIWMRLGGIGYILLWYLLGAAIVRGCMIVRRLRDAYLQLLAIFIVAITVMEVIVAYADYQLFFFRNVLYLGLLLGLLMRLPALDEAEDKEPFTHETAHGIRSAAPTKVGSRRAKLLSPESAGAATHRLVTGVPSQE
jgi:O-antigen ligase